MEKTIEKLESLDREEKKEVFEEIARKRNEGIRITKTTLDDIVNCCLVKVERDRQDWVMSHFI